MDNTISKPVCGYDLRLFLKSAVTTAARGTVTIRGYAQELEKLESEFGPKRRLLMAFSLAFPRAFLEMSDLRVQFLVYHLYS
jgi:hypothetical protein